MRPGIHVQRDAVCRLKLASVQHDLEQHGSGVVRIFGLWVGEVLILSVDDFGIKGQGSGFGSGVRGQGSGVRGQGGVGGWDTDLESSAVFLVRCTFNSVQVTIDFDMKCLRSDSSEIMASAPST